MNNPRVLVRTWFGTPKGVEHILVSVEYPLSVIQQIRAWAVEHQLNLLHRKYIDIPKKQTSDLSSAAFTASNQLWAQLQQSGYNTENDRHAIAFLFSLHEDNPELIDLSVTEQFLAELEQS